MLLRFYTTVRAGNGIYPVRIFALHKENTNSFDLSGDVYDIIFEKQQQGVATPLPKNPVNSSGFAFFFC